MVMNTKFRRTLMQLAISAAVAVVTPAAAAGLVEGVSAAANTVADASTPSIVSIDSNGGSQMPDSRVATHGPMRLSALAGDDDLAKADVRNAPHRTKR